MRQLSKPLMLLVGIFYCLSSGLYAQQNQKVTGIVKDEKGAPLQGATVQEKGVAGNQVLADNTGRFSIVLKGSSNRLVISFTGLISQELKVAAGDMLVQLKINQQAAPEVVVIGYQQVKRRNLTSAVSTIQGKDIQNIAQPSFDQMLQGRLAGVSVLSSTGELGSRPTITIRGSTNVDYGNANGGNSGPLYVIDGVVFDVNSMGTSYGNNNPLSFINPNDIETIDVLKDASASAIYGARGGNGVIIIKTRGAKTGKAQITGSLYAGITSTPNFRKVYTGAAERKLKLDLLYEGLSRQDIADGKIPIQLTDSLNPAFNNNIDWQGLMIRDNAMVNSQDIAISGSMGNNNYRISFNHYKEEGLLNGYSLEKLTPHLNLTIHPVKGMSITNEILISSESRKHGIGGSNGTLFNSWNFPTSLVKLSDEQVNVYSGKKSYYDDNKIFTIVGSVALVDTIVPNLTLHSTFAANNYSDKYAFFSPKQVNGVQNSAYDIGASNPGWSFENYLSYTKTIKKNNLVLTGGASAYSNKSYNNYAYANGVNVTGINTIQTVPSGPNLFVATTYNRKTTASYYGRITYDYDGKYLFMASLRRDASSIYSSDYRWATFPAFSAGWIVSDEKFFEPLEKVVNFFKIRASWGITGNDPGSWYAKYQTLYGDASFVNGTTGTLVANGSNTTVGGTPSTYNGTGVVSPFPYYNYIYNFGVKASNDVRWEKSPQVDIGVDLDLFKGRIHLEADWYQRDTKDKYFYSIPAQATSGYQYYSGNYVDVRNTGFELAVSTRNLGPLSAFQWNTNFNIAFNKNVVTKLPNGNRDFIFGEPWFQKTLTLGEPLFNYKVWQINGAYSTDADVPTDPVTGKKMAFYGNTLSAGDANYTDMNGDYNINFDDKVNIGNPNPKFTGGFSNSFSYKGFGLNVFCSFLSGRKVFNGALSDYLNGSRNYQSWGTNAGPAALTDVLDQFWKKPGDHTKYPRLVYPNGSAQDPWNIASSYFVEDGSFLKVKAVTLNYNFPELWAKKIGMSRLNFYVMGDNIHIFKKSQTIKDPELADPTSGSVNVIYPSSLKFTVGVNFGLK